MRGIIGPNGAGKSTFFKMLTCEVPPTSGTIVFEGRDITGKSVTDVCQLGLTKSYQINQLFDRLTVRQNLRIAALAQIRGKFKLDLFRSLRSVPGLDEQVEQTLALVNLTERPDTPVSELAYGEKRRLEIGLALATSPSLLLLDEPLAGMSPRERVETVALLKSIARGRTMIIIDHDMDFAVRTRRKSHRAAGRPRAGRGDARGDQDQCQGAGGLSRRRSRRGGMSLLEVKGLNSYYGDSHILFDVSLRVEKHEAVALARPERRRQEHDAQEPDGHRRAAQRQHQARRRRTRRPEGPQHRASRHAACARGSAHLRQPQRRGEHHPRGADRQEQMAARAHLRNVPPAQGAPREPRHRPFRRRAADAGDRARAGARSEDHPA